MATSFIAKQAEEKRRQEALGEGWDQNRSQSLLFDPLTSLRYGEFLGHAVEVGLCLSANYSNFTMRCLQDPRTVHSSQ